MPVVTNIRPSSPYGWREFWHDPSEQPEQRPADESYQDHEHGKAAEERSLRARFEGFAFFARGHRNRRAPPAPKVKPMIDEQHKAVVDYVATSVTVATVVGWLPQATAALTFIWVTTRLWESATVQRLLRAVCERCAAWWQAK